MKTLRYLLVAIAMVFVSLSAEAQFTQINSVEGCSTFDQTDRQYHFYSTSVMASSGSMLSKSTLKVASTTDETSSSISGRRRIGGNTSGGSEDRDDPMENPIGDGVWAMLLMAAGYLIYRVRTRKREVMI